MKIVFLNSYIFSLNMRLVFFLCILYFEKKNINNIRLVSINSFYYIQVKFVFRIHIKSNIFFNIPTYKKKTTIIIIININFFK